MELRAAVGVYSMYGATAGNWIKSHFSRITGAINFNLKLCYLYLKEVPERNVLGIQRSKCQSLYKSTIMTLQSLSFRYEWQQNMLMQVLPSLLQEMTGRLVTLMMRTKDGGPAVRDREEDERGELFWEAVILWCGQPSHLWLEAGAPRGSEDTKSSHMCTCGRVFESACLPFYARVVSHYIHLCVCVCVPSCPSCLVCVLPPSWLQAMPCIWTRCQQMHRHTPLHWSS